MEWLEVEEQLSRETWARPEHVREAARIARDITVLTPEQFLDMAQRSAAAGLDLTRSMASVAALISTPEESLEEMRRRLLGE